MKLKAYRLRTVRLYFWELHRQISLNSPDGVVLSYEEGIAASKYERLKKMILCFSCLFAAIRFKAPRFTKVVKDGGLVLGCKMPTVAPSNPLR